jgi:hypothetical protein
MPSNHDSMSASVLYMSVSVDGFIAGPNETPDNPLGDGGHRLHDFLCWLRLFSSTSLTATRPSLTRPRGPASE